MDKETQEKIAQGMFQLVFLIGDKEIDHRWKYLLSSVKRQWRDKAESLIEVFEQLGYRKLPTYLNVDKFYKEDEPSKPPLLSDVAKEIQRLTDNPTWKDLQPLRKMLFDLRSGLDSPSPKGSRY